MDNCEDENDKLEIVNRSKTYIVSKKLLCSSVPYFEKMFCCELLESKENKVTLDLDESAFNNIINYVYGNSCLFTMENILQTYYCCDYLMLDNLKEKCSKFFYDYFNIDHLPYVLTLASESCNIITPKMINCFIKRHFLKIANTKAFLKFPIEVIEHICKLDLVVNSEYQVFDAIKRWIEFDKSRKIHKIRLIKLIRWCFVEQEDLDKIKYINFIENSKDLDEILCSPVGEHKIHSVECKNGCISNRIIARPPIIISKVDESTIDLIIIDGSNFFTPCGQFKLHSTLTRNLITDENITDIIYYNQDRKGIRIDWVNKRFVYLDLIGTDDSYFNQIYRYIMYSFLKPPDMKSSNFDLASQDEFCFPYGSQVIIFDSDQILVAFAAKLGNNALSRFYYPISRRSCFYNISNPYPYTGCVIKDKISLITYYQELIELNKTTGLRRTLCRLDNEFALGDLQLFTIGDKLYLCQISKKKIYLFDETEATLVFVAEIEVPKPLITIASPCSPILNNNMLFTIK